jgi:hypothetical protein
VEEELLARERELDNRDSAIVPWEGGLAAFSRVLGEVHTERDTSHECADAI